MSASWCMDRKVCDDDCTSACQEEDAKVMMIVWIKLDGGKHTSAWRVIFFLFIISLSLLFVKESATTSPQAETSSLSLAFDFGMSLRISVT
jgi:hypothetical protein